MNMKRIQILFLLCLALSFTFSIFAQDKDTKEVIILQKAMCIVVSNLSIRRGTNTIIKVVFFAGLLFSNSSEGA